MIYHVGEQCDWNPYKNRVALSSDLHDCMNETWWSIGKGKNNIHVCNRCAHLPRFNRFRKRVPINANPLETTFSGGEEIKLRRKTMMRFIGREQDRDSGMKQGTSWFEADKNVVTGSSGQVVAWLDQHER